MKEDFVVEGECVKEAIRAYFPMLGKRRNKMQVGICFYQCIIYHVRDPHGIVVFGKGGVERFYSCDEIEVEGVLLILLVTITTREEA